MKTATTHTDLKTKVLLFAISSRVFIILLSWISNAVIPDHDAGVFLLPQPPVNRTVADETINSVLGGLARWDAQYFLHVSHFGYTYENTLAFFPLFPFFTRTLAKVLDFMLSDIINPYSTVLLSAVIINLYFFVNAALKLFELSCKILEDDTLGYKSALFFCINPASIFFTAPYSESCFAFLTFSGMLYSTERNRELVGSLALGLSSCARSNGVLNFGYLAHKSLKKVYNEAQMYRVNVKLAVLYFGVVELCKLLIYTIIFFTPFLLSQGYNYITFCKGEVEMPNFVEEYGVSQGFIMPSSRPPLWCKYAIPFSYSYVQNRYWNVGFLKYYRLKQIPNFLLALPVIVLVLRYFYIFILENKKVFFSLGFTTVEHVMFQKKSLKPEFFVYAVHAAVLTIFCTMFVHIQVTTRMIASSCPVLYWFVALQYKTETDSFGSAVSSRLKTLSSRNFSLVETSQNMKSVWKTVILTEKPGNSLSYFVIIYFHSYFIVGTILFSNFLPWT